MFKTLYAMKLWGISQISQWRCPRGRGLAAIVDVSSLAILVTQNPYVSALAIVAITGVVGWMRSKRK